MTTACDRFRTRLAAGDDSGEIHAPHVAACAACRSFAASLARVDRSLEEAADAASVARLAPSLRARIVAVSRAAAGPAKSRRGRLLDLALRAAAVAAMLVAAFTSLPDVAQAGELPFPEVTFPRIRIPDAIPGPGSMLPSLAEAPTIDFHGGAFGALLGAGLLAASAWMVVRARRPA